MVKTILTPVVLICTYQRLDITSRNIRSLLQEQSMTPRIVLIVSDEEEKKYYLDQFPEITCAVTLNSPLGMKFQYGVLVARQLGPDPLIILGSDDILGREFVKRVCELQWKGAEFVGLKQWYIYHNQTLYLYDYRTSIPLGTRSYSRRMLDAIGWKVFDTDRERLLDDQGFQLARKTGLKMHISTNVEEDNLQVISVKGNWPTLNPYNKIKESTNCKLVKQRHDVEGFL